MTVPRASKNRADDDRRDWGAPLPEAIAFARALARRDAARMMAAALPESAQNAPGST